MTVFPGTIFPNSMITTSINRITVAWEYTFMCIYIIFPQNLISVPEYRHVYHTHHDMSKIPNTAIWTIKNRWNLYLQWRRISGSDEEQFESRQLALTPAVIRWTREWDHVVVTWLMWPERPFLSVITNSNEANCMYALPNAAQMTV